MYKKRIINNLNIAQVIVVKSNTRVNLLLNCIKKAILLLKHTTMKHIFNVYLWFNDLTRDCARDLINKRSKVNWKLIQVSHPIKIQNTDQLRSHIPVSRKTHSLSHSLTLFTHVSNKTNIMEGIYVLITMHVLQLKDYNILQCGLRVKNC